jgi:hypothetical protein
MDGRHRHLRVPAQNPAYRPTHHHPELKAKTGVIAGTPKKQTGTFRVTLQVTDRAKPKHVATRAFMIVV